ncbi:hypothetical protein MHH70_17435 [Metasolibacillus sp. FSL H7-0170]|uniref:hypothetical protein n=1 Tax=Metasolibacillus TaxID=2703677 RepID=UPI00079A941B|nr:hypothetical protein [Metasolibacillus fluoroglycofenilyticus]KYG90425.1 hypothetical protein A0U40_05485 [[Bacillus] sp. KCTC 13219]
MASFILNFSFIQFPEDKSSYLPAAIEVLLLMVFCVFVVKLIRKFSKKQELAAKELEARALAERDERMKQENQQ